uniref:Uncharacterized protein n=1 Tax=Arundo donax TaxID=35708 RepID=A0A0A9BP80_ARUDO
MSRDSCVREDDKEGKLGWTEVSNRDGCGRRGEIYVCSARIC